MTAYLIRMVLCSALFILVYKALLEKQRMHGFNRIYLLAALVLPLLIPLLSFTVEQGTWPTVEEALPDTLVPARAGEQQSFAPAIKTADLPDWLWIGYAVITGCLLLRFTLLLFGVFRTIRRHTVVPSPYAKLVLINSNLVPHSFLHYIFISKTAYAAGQIETEILLHESAHVRQKHSCDILLAELLQAFCWFNPFLLLYRKCLRLNHEFLADAAVVEAGTDPVAYQYLLLGQSGKSGSPMLASRFSYAYAVTKKRLIMITKTSSFRQSLCRQIALIPIMAIAVLLFSARSFAQDTVITPRPVPARVPSTAEGVSQALLDEYAAIVDAAKSAEGKLVFNKFSAGNKKRLETIFLAMSREQQSRQQVMFVPAPPPFTKAMPAKAQLEVWKNAQQYGVWIDDKRVSNAVLGKYKAEDFGHFFVSRLSKNAVNYGRHYYQVDLMTTAYYDTYYRQTLANAKKYYMVIASRRSTGS